jgi:GNAT superfamily N-acetyltransferase
MNNDGKCTITDGTQEDVDFINKKIDEYNSSQAPFSQQPVEIGVNYSLKNDNGNLVGGITAFIYGWKILYIHVLWVQDEYRHNDYGSKLLKRVEDEAKAMGSNMAILDTFDFQAKDFYLKHGYEIYGELDNYPPGHKSFSMKKVLK